MAWFNRKKKSSQRVASNAIETTAKAIKSRPIQLSMQDKHEPFGNLSIDSIKAMLEDEEFSQMQSLFFYMMRDLKIAAAVLTRRQQLIGQRVMLQSDNEPFKQWVADHVPLDDLITQAASAIYYGVSVTDVAYDVQDLQLVPTFKHISPRYLYADTYKNKARLKSTFEHLYIRQDTKRIFLTSRDPSTLIFHKHPIDIGEITDFSLASKLIWYFSLKHMALAHNLAYFDNVATPPLIAKSSGNEDELINTLYSLKSSCVGVFDKDDVVEYLNVSSKADFLAFIEYIDRQMVTLILGNTLSTSEGKNGSRAQSQVHEQRQIDILYFDARLIEKTITRYLNRLEKLNFANPQGIIFKFDMKQEKNLLDLSGVVKNLSDSGFLIDEADIEAQFGFKIIGKKDTAASTQANNSHRGKVLFGADSGEKRALTPNSMTPNSSNQESSCPCCNSLTPSHNAQAKPYDTLDQQIPTISTQKIEGELLAGILKVIANAATYEEAYQSLLAGYPDMSINALESVLFNQTANAALLGVAEIEQETSS